MNTNEVVNQVSDVVEQELDLSVEVESDAIPGTRAAGFGGKTKAQKEADMRQFFAANPTIYKLGHLLAIEVQGKTLAAWMIEGKFVPVPAVKLPNGQKIAPKYDRISLSEESVTKHWGCPACQSAHGTGVGVSAPVSEKYLKGNEWYYGVETNSLFTISDTCFGRYVKATGLKSQIKGIAAPVAAPKANGKGGKK